MVATNPSNNAEASHAVLDKAIVLLPKLAGIAIWKRRIGRAPRSLASTLTLCTVNRFLIGTRMQVANAIENYYPIGNWKECPTRKLLMRFSIHSPRSPARDAWRAVLAYEAARTPVAALIKIVLDDEAPEEIELHPRAMSCLARRFFCQRSSARSGKNHSRETRVGHL